MGTVETYKSTTPRIVSGQLVPAQHPWQDRDLRDFREREREREPHRPQISDFGCSEFWNVFGAKTKRHNSEFNASLITQIRWNLTSCTLFVHVFVSGLEAFEKHRGVSIVNDAPVSVRRWRVATLSSFECIYCVWHSTITCNGRPMHLTTQKSIHQNLRCLILYFAMRCQNHKAIGFLKGNTLLWFSWECRNHHDRAPLHAQKTQICKTDGQSYSKVLWPQEEWTGFGRRTRVSNILQICNMYTRYMYNTYLVVIIPYTGFSRCLLKWDSSFNSVKVSCHQSRHAVCWSVFFQGQPRNHFNGLSLPHWIDLYGTSSLVFAVCARCKGVNGQALRCRHSNYGILW